MDSHIRTSLTRRVLEVQNITDCSLENIQLTIYSRDKMGETLEITSSLAAFSTTQISIDDNKLLNHSNKYKFSYIIGGSTYWTKKIKSKSFINKYHNYNLQIASSTQPNEPLSLISPLSSTTTSTTSSVSSSPSYKSLIIESDMDRIDFNDVITYDFHSHSYSHSRSHSHSDSRSNLKTKTNRTKKKKRVSAKERKSKTKLYRHRRQYVIPYEDDTITTRCYMGKKK
eukprot:53306_1